MTRTRFILSAIIVAAVIYLTAFEVIALMYGSKCSTLGEYWWGAVHRCTVAIPVK